VQDKQSAATGGYQPGSHWPKHKISIAHSSLRFLFHIQIKDLMILAKTGLNSGITYYSTDIVDWLIG